MQRLINRGFFLKLQWNQGLFLKLQKIFLRCDLPKTAKTLDSILKLRWKAQPTWPPWPTRWLTCTLPLSPLPLRPTGGLQGRLWLKRGRRFMAIWPLRRCPNIALWSLARFLKYCVTMSPTH